MGHWLWEDDPGEPVALGVLLPVNKVGLGINGQSVGQDLGTAMGRRAQANNLRGDGYGAVVAVVRAMMQRHMDTHDDVLTSTRYMGAVRCLDH